MELINLYSFILVACLSLSNTISATAQWAQTSNGLYGGWVRAMLATDGQLFAGTFGGVYRSSNNGSTWSGASAGLDNGFINCFASSNGNVFVATNGSGAVYITTDQGDSWTLANAGLPEQSILRLVVIDTYVFALTSDYRLYQTADNGASWTWIDTGLNGAKGLATAGNKLFVGAEGGVFPLTKNGSSWTVNNSVLTSPDVRSLAADGANLVAGTSNGVYFSSDSGVSWMLVGLPQGNDCSIIGKGDTVIIGNELYAFRATSNDYTSWLGIPDLVGASWLVANGNSLLAANHSGIHRSDDSGLSWSTQNIGLTNARIYSLAIVNDYLLAGTGTGVFRSHDSGALWTPASVGLPTDIVTSLTVKGSIALAALYNSGIYISTNMGDSWNRVSSTWGIESLTYNDTHFFAGGFTDVYRADGTGISWNPLSTGFLDTKSVVVSSQGLLAANADGISLSTNDGQSWSRLNNGLDLSYNSPTGLFLYGDHLFAGLSNDGIYSYSWNNKVWTSSNTGLTNDDWRVTCFEANNEVLFAGGSGGVHYSIDTATWITMNQNLPHFYPGNIIESLVVSNGKLFAGTSASGVWQWCGEPPPKPTILAYKINNNDTLLISSAAIGNQWFLNGSAIPGATDSTLAPSLSGIYTVQVSNGGCPGSPVSEPQICVVTGIETPLAPTNSMDVSPNPSAALVAIRLSGYKSGTIQFNLLDVLGNKVKSIVAESGEDIELDLGACASGLYVLISNQDGISNFVRIVKK